MHIAADRFDRGALAGVQRIPQQRPQAVLRPVLLQADHLAADQVGQHGPKVLPFAALDFVHAQMARPALRPCPVPGLEKGAFRSPRRAPTHRMANGGVTRRHRLTVQPNPPLKAARQPRMQVGKVHSLGPNATVATPEPPQRIPQRDWMLRPGQVVPGADLLVPHTTRPPVATRTDIVPQAPALDPNDETPIGFSLELDHSVCRQPQNPRTITQRSHPVLPLCRNSERTPSALPMASGIAVVSSNLSPGPAVAANPALRGARVKTEAPRGPRAARRLDAWRAQGYAARPPARRSTLRNPAFKSTKSLSSEACSEVDRAPRDVG